MFRRSLEYMAVPRMHKHLSFSRFAPIFVGQIVIVCLGVQAQQPPALVRVSPVVEKVAAGGQTFTGTVVPTRTSIVGSAVDGRVNEMFFDEGDLVRSKPASGTESRTSSEIARLRTKTISLDVAVATAELEALHQTRVQLETSLPEELAQSKARLQAAEALMNYHKARYTRAAALFKDGSVVSKENLDEVQSAWISAQQNHASAKSSLTQLVNTRDSRLAGSRARELAQQEKVRQLEDIMSKYTIRAPFDGFVSKKFTEVGAWLSRGDPVVEVIELDPVEIDVFVPESYISKVKVGSSVSITIDALSDRVLIGNVSRIIPQADLRSRSFPVKIRMSNPDYAIKAGMLVRATIAVGSSQPVLMAPKDALNLAGRQRAVVVASKDEASGQVIAKMVPVQTGVSDGTLIQMIGDLKAGDMVVVRGNERLRPGQPLKIATQRETAAAPN